MSKEREDKDKRLTRIRSLIAIVNMLSEELQESTVERDEVGSILDAANDGIFVINLGTKEILSVNKTGRDQLGYDEKELIGLPFTELYAAEDLDSIKMHIGELMINGSVIFEARQMHKDGSYVYVEVSSKVFTFKGQHVIQSFVRDIRMRKQAEHQAQKQAEQLEKTNKALQQFNYVATHDLKEPLRNLNSLFDYLKEKGSLSEDQSLIVNKMTGVTKRLEQTITDLNEVILLTQKNKDSHEEVQIQLIIDDVNADLEAQIQKSRAQLEVDLNLFDTVTYSPVQLKSIIQNLVSNAIKYKKDDVNPVIKITAGIKDGWKFLEVKDNGKGLDLQKHGKKLFGLFQRFDLDAPGKGIGLYTVKQIVEQRGGWIEVQSEPDVGSVFTVFLHNGINPISA
jgi:PAS domain S-box-containing protein